MNVLMHINPAPKAADDGADLSFLSPDKALAVRRFHSGFEEYAPTPLVPLPNLARELGLARFLVKDESPRFGLNAFKALGASYAVGRCLARLAGLPPEQMTCEALRSEAVRQKIGPLTFISATDGNHGRGLAWTARQLGYKAVILMPKGSAQIRVENIRAQGADCRVTDLVYDDTVRLAADLARQNNWILVQDTAWDGYEEIPGWIMQGYMTMTMELLEQSRALGVKPTHCFLQAGVGSFPAALAGSLIAALGPEAPAFICVEPLAADCVRVSAEAGERRAVGGDLRTLMAGLACGEVSSLSWDILRDHFAAHMAMPDHVAADGMRVLAAPLPGDTPIVSGESGAAGAGAAQWLMRSPKAKAWREALGLGEASSVLVISTEGDTDPVNYRNVVWFGAHAGI